MRKSQAAIVATALALQGPQLTINPAGIIEPHNTHTDICTYFFRFLPERVSNVLLYELVTGTTPFDEETFWPVGYDELRRMIREQEPPCPSACVPVECEVNM